MATIKKKINILCLFVMIICGMLIVVLNVRTSVTGLGNASAAVYSDNIVKSANTIAENASTDEEKVKAFYSYIIKNFDYDKNIPLFQHSNLDETIETKKGMCFDFSNLFAAYCRTHNIPCVVVEGISDSSRTIHQWNRVFFNDTWYDVDITNDISAYKQETPLYGFVEIEGKTSSADGYTITKIL